ncbi:response regulator [Tunturiibacter gelidoferens]|uniref:DNA-binding NtrC family response regulator n=1 Tax=Tunturiibacter lichenicola TaxID=2051959 RepID=A0A7Y9T4G2_9BACT|nr:response regulator [Edaphobacter lichenicola]NYF53983.1 DNA-binding NtrC family response regulator [Edaphobacter lichenicola]
MENPFETQPSIFVVDDEEEIAKMFAVVLQMNLFNAVPYFDPLAALEAARISPPDYLLTDVMMPGLNGVELAMAVRAIAPGCKMLIFSGQESSGAMIEIANEQGYDFTLVLKPIHPTKMVELIRGL